MSYLFIIITIIVIMITNIYLYHNNIEPFLNVTSFLDTFLNYLYNTNKDINYYTQSKYFYNLQNY